MYIPNHITDLYNEFVHAHGCLFTVKAELVVRLKYKMVQPYDVMMT